MYVKVDQFFDMDQTFKVEAFYFFYSRWVFFQGTTIALRAYMNAFQPTYISERFLDEVATWISSWT